MGSIITNVQDFKNMMLPSIEVEKLVDNAELPVTLSLDSVEDGFMAYSFEHEGTPLQMVWTENILLVNLDHEDDRFNYPLVVHVQGDPEQGTAQHFKETLRNYLAAVRNWSELSKLDVVQNFADHFQMSYDHHSVIIQDGGFRCELTMKDKAFQLTHLEPDVNMIDEDEEFETPLDIPLNYFDTVDVHPVMGQSFLHFMADHFGLEDLDGLFDALGPTLSAE